MTTPSSNKTEPKTERIYWRARADVSAALDEVAAKTRLPVTEVLDQCLREYLGLPQPPPETKVADVVAQLRAARAA